MILPREFYNRPTLDVARDLIGKSLVHITPAGRTSGIIVEVEAYIGESDPACHAAPGRTKRNAPLYGEPGIAYVYFNYGVHWLVNAVTEAIDSPAAVLIRALEPEEGIALMQKRRARGSGKPAASFEVNGLCRGPGNLTKALGIAAAENQRDLTRAESALFIDTPRVERAFPIAWGPRIGIRVGMEQAWRCYVPGHACVSGRPSLNGGGRGATAPAAAAARAARR